jgi:tyrosine-protein kinase Etk/Wzc
MPSSDVDGLAEVLIGALPLESAIQRGTLENLDYLPAARRLPMNPAELLDRPEFEMLVHRLKAQYDHIVIDSPPVLPVTDSLLIAAHSDLVFLISRTDVTTERQLREAVGRFNTAGIAVTGHVFNGFKVARYGYGYQHAYQQYSKFA